MMDINLGDYVFAHRWSDCDWNDPWAVGFVCEIGRNFVRLDDGGGGLIEGVGRRAWPCFQRVSGDVGANILEHYPGREGTTFDPEVAQKILTKPAADAISHN